MGAHKPPMPAEGRGDLLKPNIFIIDSLEQGFRIYAIQGDYP